MKVIFERGSAQDPSTEMNDASTWRIGVPVAWFVMTLFTTIARVMRSRTKHVLIICNGLKDIAITLCRPASLTVVRYSLERCSSLLVSDRVSDNWPHTLRSASSVNEPQMNESRMRILYFIPNLGYCIVELGNQNEVFWSEAKSGSIGLECNTLICL